MTKTRTPKIAGALHIEPGHVEVVLNTLIRVADMMGGSLGRRHEVVVHDLRRDKSVVHVVNGSVTNREVGQGIRDLLGVLNAPAYARGMLLNYEAPVKIDDRTIRASTLVFSDESGGPILAVCLNIDVTDWVRFESMLGELAFPTGRKLAQVNPGGGSLDINSILDLMIEEAIDAVNCPLDRMGKDEKLSVVRFLDLRGVFLVRHAHARVSKALGLSKETVFRYLQQSRESNDNA